MAKKALAVPAKKAPAKRKPRPKKPVTPADFIDTDVAAKRLEEVFSFNERAASGGAFVRKRINAASGEIETYSIEPPPKPPAPGQTLGTGEYGSDGEAVDITSWIPPFLKAVALLVLGGLGGIWAAGGIDIGGDVRPMTDCLAEAHAADRATQVAVLKELASQPFDGTTDEGRKKAGEWFNAQRFRNRSSDFGVYTDAVAEAIAANSEAELAKNLEGK